MAWMRELFHSGLGTSKCQDSFHLFSPIQDVSVIKKKINYFYILAKRRKTSVRQFLIWVGFLSWYELRSTVTGTFRRSNSKLFNFFCIDTYWATALLIHSLLWVLSNVRSLSPLLMFFKNCSFSSASPAVTSICSPCSSHGSKASA